jgi:hypothetical protein
LGQVIFSNPYRPALRAYLYCLGSLDGSKSSWHGKKF